MKYLLSILLITSIMWGCKTTGSQAFFTEKQLDSLIVNKTFEFAPNTALPTGYRGVNLSYGYFLRISNDSIEAYLPYFGRSHTATMATSDAGIKFISTNFDYTVEEKKVGLYEIVIKTKDTPRNSIFYLSAGSNGYGSLRVQENDRQSISFNGNIDGIRR